ncbi:nitrous oxide-stimulated promoter family protein [bacterium]|nr:nitrous oxide-stimulated promoter family protein [bacterium]
MTRRTGPPDPRRVERELGILRRFTAVYCRAHHGREGSGLCAECAALLEYAHGRRQACPYDPKPKCKRCPTHCYQPALRRRVREVMRYGGMYFVRRGRLDWLVRYFLN